MAAAGGSIQGVIAVVKWGYYNAAAIEGYKVTRSADNRWTLRATVVTFDRFKLSQKPLILVAPIEGGAWRWTITDLELQHGERLVATLSQPLP